MSQERKNFPILRYFQIKYLHFTFSCLGLKAQNGFSDAIIIPFNRYLSPFLKWTCHPRIDGIRTSTRSVIWNRMEGLKFLDLFTP